MLRGTLAACLAILRDLSNRFFEASSPYRSRRAFWSK